MGCVSSRTDINDLHPNVFKVMNVDEQGQLVSPGQLELTETEMVLYQRGKSTTRWPLAYIRRYGFESELFSFESGRRCPTGPGIFAFRCRRAEQLFNLLHQHIAIQRSQSEDMVNHTPNDFPIPLVTSGPAVPVRPLTQTSEASYLEPLPTRQPVTRTHSVAFTRLNSISSNGPTSPSTTTPPLMTSPEPAPPEHNNNKRASLSLQHSYINTLLPNENEAGSTSYMNIERPVSPTGSTGSETYPPMNDGHLYMNITPGELPTPSTPAPPLRQSVPECPPNAVYLPNDVPMPTLPLLDEKEEDPRHCYANLETDEIEGLRNIMISSENVPPLPQTPTGVIKEVIYADLVLGKTKDACLPVVLPESPKQPAKGYTIIDFNKTVAVSQIVKPSQDLNSEGSRKTRHNSTINELAQTSSRHSSSLSD